MFKNKSTKTSFAALTIVGAKSPELRHLLISLIDGNFFELTFWKLILFNISAKSFLHSQVRIIVGTLVEVGKGKIEPEDIQKIIESNDRKKAGPTAPAHGLYLVKDEY